MNSKVVFSFLIVVSLLVLASGRVVHHNNTIPTHFTGGETLRGTLNLSLNGVNLNGIVRTNLNSEGIPLRVFLEAHGLSAPEDYTCSVSSCLTSYNRRESVTNFDLSGEQLVGFSLQGGSVARIDEARVDFQGSSAPSCFADLSLDVLDQGDTVLPTTRYRLVSCYEPRYGCFETGRTDYETIIMQSGAAYCEKITLPVAPAFKAGARVTQTTQGTQGLVMQIHTMDSTSVGQCTLPSFNGTANVECLIPYNNPTQADHFVCVSPTGAGSAYRIRTEVNAACGTNDFGVTYPGDYEIYAQNMQFDTPHISLNETAFQTVHNIALRDYLSAYVTEMYGGVCTPFCTIPLKLLGAPQEISIENPLIRYTSALGTHESTSLYRLEEHNVTVNASTLILDLRKANFTLPTSSRERRLILYLDDEVILEKPFNLSTSFSFDVRPLFATLGQATFFNVSTPNARSVQWDFGDGSAPQTSQGSSITHRYLSQGTFILEADVTRADGLVGRRTFSILVGNAEEAARTLLNESKESLRTIDSALSGYESWVQEEIKSSLAYEELTQSVQELSFRYDLASNESEYTSIVTEIIALNVPSRVRTQTRGTVPLVGTLTRIDISPLRELSEAQGGSSEDVQAAIAAWMLEQSSAEVSFTSIVADYPAGSEPLLTTFRIQTKPRTAFEDETYLFINLDPQDLNFVSPPTSPQAIAGSTALLLESSDQTITFSVQDVLLPGEIGMFISPVMSRLGSFEEGTYQCNYNAVCQVELGEDWRTCPNDCRPWGPAFIIILGLIIAGGIVLLGVLIWYKLRYESKLFPKRQDLVNLLAFIASSFQSGMKELAIKKKLHEAGWTGEQIRYALKKYRKKKSEKPASDSDVKFIKRPDFKAP